MKLTFLGTGAGEGYPGLWCECPHCAYARTHGGKNLRTNSCAVLDEKVLLDMGPACFDNAARYGVNLCHVTSLLITHPHEDHLYPQHLEWRKTNDENIGLSYREKLFKGGPRFTPVPEMTVYGAAVTRQLLGNLLDQFPSMHMSFYEYSAGETFVTEGGYTVTAIRGKHGSVPAFAHSFVIHKEGRTMLYALDTGTYEPDMMERVLSFRYDLVVMEGTTGLNEQYGGHMCLENNRKMKKLLEENGCMNEGCRFVLTHMSPHWCPPHDMYESIVAQDGILLAYDGMSIEV